MELADVFEKIANNARLTPHELDFLKSSMRQTQMNNNFLSGFQDGSSNIYVGNISARKITLGQESSEGVFAYYTGSQSNVASGVASSITNWAVRTGDTQNNFYSSSGYIYTPLPGRYRIAALAVFAANATGKRGLTIGWNGESASESFNAAPAPIGQSTVYGEVSHAFVNNQIEVTASQHSGGTLDITIHVYMEKIGEYKSLPT